MEPGHPHLTREFDQLRATQRRRLAAIRWYLPQLEDTIDLKLEHQTREDAIAAEYSIRSLAADLLAERQHDVDAIEMRRHTYIGQANVNHITGPRWADSAGLRLFNRFQNDGPLTVWSEETGDRELVRDLSDAVALLDVAELLCRRAERLPESRVAGEAEDSRHAGVR